MFEFSGSLVRDHWDAKNQIPIIPIWDQVCTTSSALDLTSLKICFSCIETKRVTGVVVKKGEICLIAWTQQRYKNLVLHLSSHYLRCLMTVSSVSKTRVYSEYKIWSSLCERIWIYSNINEVSYLNNSNLWLPIYLGLWNRNNIISLMSCGVSSFFGLILSRVWHMHMSVQINYRCTCQSL